MQSFAFLIPIHGVEINSQEARAALMLRLSIHTHPYKLKPVNCINTVLHLSYLLGSKGEENPTILVSWGAVTVRPSGVVHPGLGGL